MRSATYSYGSEIKMVNIYKKKKVSSLPKQKVIKLADSAWMWIVVYPKIKIRR